MTYQYYCEKCDKKFDVIKSVREIDVNEFCPDCESPSERQFVPQHVYFSGTKVQHAEYNPGLGAVTKNKKHREELAKRKGLVEVGNDFKSGETMQTKFDTERAEKLKKRYEDI
jgi:putative FmdB family regulatory protein